MKNRWLGLACLLLFFHCGKTDTAVGPVQTPRLWLTGKETWLALNENGRLVERDGGGVEIKTWLEPSDSLLQVVLLAGKRDVLIRTREGTRVIDLTGRRADQSFPSVPKVVGAKWQDPGELWMMFEDGSIERWDAGKKKEKGLLQWPLDGVTVEEARFAEEGERVVTRIARSSTAYVWNRVTGELIAELNLLDGHRRPLLALDVSRDAGLVATGGEDGRWMLWNIDGHGVVTTPYLSVYHMYRQTLSAVTSISMSKEGDRVVTGHQDGSVKSWGSYTNSVFSEKNKMVWYEWRSFYGDQMPVQDVYWTTDTAQIAVLHQGPTLRMWRHTPDVISPLNRPAQNIDISPGGEWVVTQEGGKAYVWKTNELIQYGSFAQPVAVLTSPHVRSYEDARIHLSGRVVAAATHDLRLPGLTEEPKMDIWDISDPAHPRLVQVLRNANASGFGRADSRAFHTLVGAVFSPDGALLIQQEKTEFSCVNLNIWSVSSLLENTSPLPIVRSPCTYTDWKSFSMDGRYLVGSNGFSSVFQIWEVQPTGTFSLKATASDTQHGPSTVHGEVFSPDARSLFAMDYDQGLAIWDVSDISSPTLRKVIPQERLNMYSIQYMGMSQKGELLLQDKNEYASMSYVFDTQKERHVASGLVVFPPVANPPAAGSEARWMPDGSGAFVLMNRGGYFLYHWAVPDQKEAWRIAPKDF